MEVVAVLGASSDESRYSFQAVKLLLEKKHQAIPISLKENEILGQKCYKNLDEMMSQGIRVDTLSMYVNPTVSSALESSILKLNPKRVIFNPGSENTDLRKKLENFGVKVEEACTLVLLRTAQF